MDEQKRRWRWDNYPSVPNGITEANREIKNTNDISVECKNIDWDNNQLLEGMENQDKKC